MATAAHAEAVDAAPKKGSKKKLIIIGAAVALLLAVAGGGAMFMMKKKAAEAAAAAEADGEGGAAAEHAPAKAEHFDPHAVPTFVPLDPFTVNLADRDADRYAQVGVTFELDDAHTADRVKAYMPAIRNGVLMILAHKTSTELLERAGKEKLAREIGRESMRAMGVELDDEDPDAAPEGADAPDAKKAAEGDGADKKDKEKDKTKAKKKHKAAAETPIKRVHFSNFIIQ